MKDGVNVEQGTHEDLINKGGMYHSMVNAQQLEPLKVPDNEGEYDDLIMPKEIEPHEYSTHESEEEEDLQAGREPSKFGFFHSFCVIAREHKIHWVLYILIIVGAIGAGCEYCVPLLHTPN